MRLVFLEMRLFDNLTSRRLVFGNWHPANAKKTYNLKENSDEQHVRAS